ncbi:MAG TPA: septal ring lytic transglycosylase RlpA family protein [Rhodocyclaceae bacterium]|nr:septal ring lytic transglycosylase RlpA family protein [Rhodocyclaceae bacterium]
MRFHRHWQILGLALLLTGCGNLFRQEVRDTGSESVRQTPPASSTSAPAKRPAVVLKRGGGFYKDDGPAEDTPENLDDIPDAQPRWEPMHKPATKPYVVLGKEYIPNTSVQPYKARGGASWYGKKFHGNKTSIGEPYDMFAMTAAHTTLAIPSYVRVTNLRNGRSVVVRVNDRGPFHVGRIIDLSYAAAHKLDLITNGSGDVEVEAIIPGESNPIYAQTAAEPRLAAQAARDRDEIAAFARKLEREETTPPPAALPGRGIFVQLGAFANLDNAENLKNRLESELDWLTGNLRIHASGGIHRLHVGPYGNRDEAERTAERIRLALGYKPTIVTR